jgi:hypothetical protein
VGRAMSETLNKAVAFLDAAVAELDQWSRPVLDGSVVEWRRETAALEVPTTDGALPRPRHELRRGTNRPR